jgi:hypothetical protein
MMRKTSIMVLAAVLVVALVLTACGPAGAEPSASASAPAASASEPAVSSSEPAASPSESVSAPAASPSESVSAPAAAADEWSIAVEGGSQAAFTGADYAKLAPAKVEATLKKKDGSETKQVWEGVLLKDVLAALGIADYKSITLTASDDYSKDYTPELVNDAKTILGTVLDGKKLTADEGFVEAVAGSQPGNMWIKSLKSIKVNK